MARRSKFDSENRKACSLARTYCIIMAHSGYKTQQTIGLGNIRKADWSANDKGHWNNKISLRQGPGNEYCRKPASPIHNHGGQGHISVKPVQRMIALGQLFTAKRIVWFFIQIFAFGRGFPWEAHGRRGGVCKLCIGWLTVCLFPHALCPATVAHKCKSLVSLLCKRAYYFTNTKSFSTLIFYFTWWASNLHEAS